MNHPYLMHHVSGTLHTFVRSYPLSGSGGTKIYGNIVDFSDEPYGGAISSSKAVLTHRDDMPLIISVSDQFAYGSVSLSKSRYLIGPVRFETRIYISNVITPEELGLADTETDPEWLRSVPVCDFKDFVSALLLIHNYRKSGSPEDPFLTASSLVEYNCMPPDMVRKSQKRMTEQLFESRELGFVHNPYNHEARERAAIQSGDVEGIRRILDEDFTGRYGQLSKDPLRQEINMGIVATTIATRAAIDGGLHPETAFYISDITIQEMEASRDIERVKHISRRTEIQLTEMVRDLLAQKKEDEPVRENRHISHCKDYIFTHLHDKLPVSEIADAIGLEANYLSALFKKCEHITLKQYILNEKIKLVKNLLIYSSYSFSKIAVYLGFSSQSHLGAEFKKATGMTLKEFRDANAREDFVHDHMFRGEG